MIYMSLHLEKLEGTREYGLGSRKSVPCRSQQGERGTLLAGSARWSLSCNVQCEGLGPANYVIYNSGSGVNKEAICAPAQGHCFILRRVHLCMI
jgi:hypothetical protein